MTDRDQDRHFIDPEDAHIDAMIHRLLGEVRIDEARIDQLISRTLIKAPPQAKPTWSAQVSDVLRGLWTLWTQPVASGAMALAIAIAAGVMIDPYAGDSASTSTWSHWIGVADTSFLAELEQ